MKLTTKRLLYQLILLVSITGIFLAGCKSDFISEADPGLVRQEVSLRFMPTGELFFEPIIMVLNLEHQTDVMENIRAKLEKLDDGSYRTETFPLWEGDYTLKNWIAYDENNSSTVSSTLRDTSFSIISGSYTTIPAGDELFIESRAIPYDRFSKLAATNFYRDRIGGVYPAGDGEMIMLGSARVSGRYVYKYARLSTKGDVLWQKAYADNNYMPLNYGSRLNDGTILGVVYTTYGGYFLTFSQAYKPYIAENLIRAINPEDGSEKFTISGPDVFDWIPGYSFDNWYQARIYDVQATPDDGLVVMFGARLVVGGWSYGLTKFDSYGQREWTTDFNISNKIPSASSSGSQGLKRLVGVNNSTGNLAVFTTKKSAGNQWHPVIYHIDAAGNVTDTMDYTIADAQETAVHNNNITISSTSDNGYVLATVTNETPAHSKLIKFDGQGSVEWSKEFSDRDATAMGGGYDNVATGVDGNILYASSHRLPENNDHLYIKVSRLSLEGNIIMESDKPIQGPGALLKWNLLRANVMETVNTSNESMRGVVVTALFSPEGKGDAKLPWVFKLPSSSLKVIEETNLPTEFSYPVD